MARGCCTCTCVGVGSCEQCSAEYQYCCGALGGMGSPFFQVRFEWKLSCLVTNSQAGAAQPDVPLPPPCIMEK